MTAEFDQEGPEGPEIDPEITEELSKFLGREIYHNGHRYEVLEISGLFPDRAVVLRDDNVSILVELFDLRRFFDYRWA